MQIFQFALRPPTAGAEIVHAQLRLAHEYRNTLTEIERHKRAALRALNESVRPLELAAKAAQEDAEKAALAIKQARSSTRSKADTAELRQALSDANVRRSEARRALSEARKALREGGSLKAEQARIQGLALELQKSAREHCGAYWGSYLLVEDAAQQAFKTIPLYDNELPNDPHFVPWRSGDIGGRLGVQIQAQAGKPPFLVEHATRWSNRLFRIEPVAYRLQEGKEGLPLSKRAEKNQNAFAILHMRVSSVENGDPIWASWPMRMHRPMPQDGIIKRAVVRRYMVGPTEKWTVTITLETEARAATCGTGGAVAVDLGWRTFVDADGNTEIRVAAWRGEDGASGELRLSAWDLGGIRKADDLRSIRDKAYDKMRAELVEWFKDPKCAVPAWLTEATKTLAQWKSPKRLASVVTRWKTERFPGDEGIMGELPRFGPRPPGHKGRAPRLSYGAGLLGWEAEDRHLWIWEADQRDQALRHRRERYRVFAAGLAKRYSTLVLEDFDLRVFSRLPPMATDAEKEDNERARANKYLAAPSEARLMLINAFHARGGTDEAVSAVDTTRKCNVCHVVEKFDAGAKVSHTCKNGHTVDQDHNASANILERLPAHLAAKEPAAAPASRETRWARARRMAADKKKA